jgi:hypothetical protein
MSDGNLKNKILLVIRGINPICTNLVYHDSRWRCNFSSLSFLLRACYPCRWGLWYMENLHLSYALAVVCFMYSLEILLNITNIQWAMVPTQVYFCWLLTTLLHCFLQARNIFSWFLFFCISTSSTFFFDVSFFPILAFYRNNYGV